MHRLIVGFRLIAVVLVLALTALATPVFAQSADLTITKTAPAEVSIGANFTYTITIFNTTPGSGTADTITVTDVLPLGVVYITEREPEGWTCTYEGGSNTLTCTSDSAIIPFGGSETIEIDVQVAEGVEAGTDIDNTATVVSIFPDGKIGAPASIDPNPANNSATARVRVVGPDVTVQKGHAGNGVRGQQISYSIAATNIGSGATTGSTVVTDTLPAGLTPVSITGGAGWVCTIGPPISCTFAGAVGAGSSFPPINLVALVDNNAPATVTNNVSITTPNDTDLTNNTDSDPTTIAAVGPPPAVSLGLALGFSTPTYSSVGQVIEVRYLVTNTSAATVNTIVVTDPKVPVITCPQTSLVAGSSMTCTGPYTITAADIAAGSSAFTATVTGSGGATATAAGTINGITIQNDDFVRTRGQLLQVDPPGLHDRIGQVTAGLTETSGDPTFSFAASFLGGASTAAGDLASGAVVLPYKVWIDGKLTLHTRDNGGGGFGQLGLGSDYLVNEDLLIGAALYIDWMTDEKTDRTTTGVGYFTGPYVSAEIAEHLTFDGAIFLGGSTNDVEVIAAGNTFRGTFNTQRVIVQAQIDGLWNLEMLTIRPDATMFLRHETVGNYTVRDAAGNVVPVSGFTNTSLNLSGGAVFEKAIPLENGLIFIPQAGFRVGITGRGDAFALDNPYGSVSSGFVLEGEAWKYQSTVELALWASSLKAATWKGTLAGEF